MFSPAPLPLTEPAVEPAAAGAMSHFDSIGSLLSHSGERFRQAAQRQVFASVGQRMEGCALWRLVFDACFSLVLD